MLVEFTLGNFRSFNKPVTFSMTAETKLSENRSRLLKAPNKSQLLPTTGVFGANASGKSNIIKALYFLHRLVVVPVENQNASELYFGIEPFLLNHGSPKNPMQMEIILWDTETKRQYSYSLEIKDQQIVRESLSIREKAKERFTTKLVFERQGQDFGFGKREYRVRLMQLIGFIAKEAPAVSVFSRFNDPECRDFVKLMAKNVVTDGRDLDTSIKEFEKNNRRVQEVVKSIISQADLFIQDLRLVESTTPYSKLSPRLKHMVDMDPRNDGRRPQNIRFIDIATTHKKYGKKNPETTDFSIMTHESAGTRRLFAIATPIAQVLVGGGVAIVDDIGSDLHPLMSKALVEQFENKTTNPRGAQLIYNTHEAFLMSDKVGLRRDQFWFTEKNEKEESELVRLSDYSIRKDYRIDQNYLVGRFGAIPMLDFDKVAIER